MEISYGRPKKDDIPGIERLLKETFEDTFRKNKIVSIFEIEDEIKEKISKINQDIIEKDPRYYFMIAKDNAAVVGVCAFFPVSQIIKDYISGVGDEELEVGCAYVSPKYQKCGIGNMLAGLIMEKMQKSGRLNYYLCSGFETAQRYWSKKLGDPVYVIKDIWGEGKHELIWKATIS